MDSGLYHTKQETSIQLTTNCTANSWYLASYSM